MPKSKGFGNKPVIIKDEAPKAQGEAEVLKQVSESQLDKVRTFLEAGKAAIAAADGMPAKGTSRVISVKDVANGDDSEPESKDPQGDKNPKDEPEVEATDNAKTGLSKDDIKSLLDAAVSKAVEGTEAKFQSTIDQLNTHIDELKKEVDKGRDLEGVLKSLEGLQGSPIPVNQDKAGVAVKKDLQVLGEGSAESRAYEKLLESAQRAAVRCDRYGNAIQKDVRAADAYLWRNRERIRDGVEAVMREKGFFQGSQAATDAVTVASDIPSISYEYLSAMMRMTHYEDLIHWQFAKTDLGLGTRPGLTMGIARYDYLARPAAFTDRVLTPGTDITSSSTALAENIVPVTIQELALKTPIGISTFIDAYSMMNLETIAEQRLTRDYQYTKDLGLRTELFRTDRVVYNDAGTVTTTATEVGAGDDGTLTDNFMIALRAYMKRLQIPPMEDGCYVLLCNPTSLAQFVQSKGAKERDAAIESGMDMMSRMIAQTTGFEGGEVRGYYGKYNGFHVFEQNVYGIEGGTEGVNSTTLGDSNSYDLLTNFAIGREPICWGTALPVEIRADEVTDFNRRQRLIWYSHETPDSLDVKTTAGTGEQLRVIEFRAAPSAI